MIVVDTSAVIAILMAEEDAFVFANRLAREDEKVWSAATALEAFIVARRKLGEEGAAHLDELVFEFSLRAVAFDPDQLAVARAAYPLYGRGSGHPARLNFGDCFAYALAKSLDAPLLYKGDDFVHTDIRAAIRP